MRFSRYLLIQLLAYSLDIGVFILLLAYFSIEPLLANMISKILAGSFAFFAHRSFTFSAAKAGIIVHQGIRYFALLALNIPLSSLVLSLILRVMTMAVVAKFIADMICVVMNYWLSKRFVFVGHDAQKNKVDKG